jgi:hypothetical protein
MHWTDFDSRNAAVESAYLSAFFPHDGESCEKVSAFGWSVHIVLCLESIRQQRVSVVLSFGRELACEARERA